jgi:hypothetical protein
LLGLPIEPCQVLANRARGVLVLHKLKLVT